MVNENNAAKTRKTELVIWDWNGTLLDDTELCYTIANEMRVERGMAPLADTDAYRGMFRFPVIDYYRAMGYTFASESYEEISVEFHALYAARVHTCALQPHAEEALCEIARRGVPQVLLSATGADRLYGQAELFGLPRYFTQIIGSENNLANGKAGQAHALLARSGVSPERAVFIGDTDHDYEVAAAVGCRCLLLTSGHQLPAHLKSLGAPMIDSLAEAPNAIL